MSVAEATVEVSNRLGLHLRAATKLAETARSFKSTIKLTRGQGRSGERAQRDRPDDARAPAIGTKLKVRAEGPDARAALDAVQRLFQDRFGED